MKKDLRASIPIHKPIIMIDLDGVLADFDKRKAELEAEGFKGDKLFSHPSAYKDLELIPGAVKAWELLQDDYETYFLSTPPWSNPDAWAEKRKWVDQHFGKSAHKKLILTHNKGLVKGDYLIDDRIANGVSDFEGEHIHFGSASFPNWDSIISYLIQ